MYISHDDAAKKTKQSLKSVPHLTANAVSDDDTAVDDMIFWQVTLISQVETGLQAFALKRQLATSHFITWRCITS
ncbi:MAG: hypothetical protein IPG31_07780 [Nitrosomonas sp.]|nr:hypothetical protein [Nitrosomonas sp.]